MNISFNADEIFEMAEEIERNGAKFYRKAAKNATDGETKKMLLGLAAMEDGHEKIFAAMREELSIEEKEPTVYDPDNQAAMYLQMMADSHGSEGKKSPVEEITGNEPIEEILMIALNSEKDSVVFYMNMKAFLKTKTGKDKVKAIIDEEVGHINSLNEKLKELV
ncbi:MAG TPA: ferritin family protein [Sedimentisphaerales bacterium]|nr:ferritin family protein [Sedimentisphaerales bacterium]